MLQPLLEGGQLLCQLRGQAIAEFRKMLADAGEFFLPAIGIDFQQFLHVGVADGKAGAVDRARGGEVTDRGLRCEVRILFGAVATVEDLAGRSVGFRSLQEQLDTTTAGGKLIFLMFASLAEFERDLIRERTHAGLTAARARGRNGGRPKGVDEKKRKAAVALKRDPSTAFAKSVRLSASLGTPPLNTPASERVLVFLDVTL